MSEATQPTLHCRYCGQRKLLDEFYRHPTDPMRKRSRCRDCSRAHQLEYLRERIEFLRAYKIERGCMDCGYADHWCALDLDHRPGEIKLYEPATLKAVPSWEAIHAELAKCDVVCANCHRIRTNQRPAANRNHDLQRKSQRPELPPLVDPDQLALFDPAA